MLIIMIMKICIIPPDKEPAYLDRITSGQERVARDNAKFLTELGYNVDYLLFSGSEILEGFNCREIPIKPRSLATSKNPKRPNPQTTEKRRWIEQHHDEYDLFICHADSTVMLKELVKCGRGTHIISFIHNQLAGTMWGIGFNSGQGRARHAGGKIIAVSERCKNHWNRWSSGHAARFRSGLNNNISRPDLLNSSVVFDELVSEIFCPQVATTSTNPLPGLKPVVLARIAKDKRLDLAFALGVKFICCKDDMNYFQKVEKKLLKEEVVLDRSWEECMKELATASVLISTCPTESSPISVFEAAERGVPAILVEDRMPHGAREFLPDWAYVTCSDNHASLQVALASIPEEWRTMEFRNRLQQWMLQHWGADAYKLRLQKLIAI